MGAVVYKAYESLTNYLSISPCIIMVVVIRVATSNAEENLRCGYTTSKLDSKVRDETHQGCDEMAATLLRRECDRLLSPLGHSCGGGLSSCYETGPLPGVSGLGAPLVHHGWQSTFHRRSSRSLPYLEVPSIGDGLTGLINITHIPLHHPSLKTKRSDYADDLIFAQNLTIRSITVRSMRDD
jgi:hypothetical protein